MSLLITFTVLQCPELTIANARKDTQDRSYDIVVTVACNVGHEYPDRSRVRSTICTHHKTWSSPIPDCQREWNKCLFISSTQITVPQILVFRTQFTNGGWRQCKMQSLPYKFIHDWCQRIEPYTY